MFWFRLKGGSKTSVLCRKQHNLAPVHIHWGEVIFMHNVFKSWLFFTALLLLFLTLAVTLPGLSDKLFGSTELQLDAAAQDVNRQIQEVWANLTP